MDSGPVKATIVKTLAELRSSYWFLPGIMAFGAIVLATLVIWLDSAGWGGWIEEVAWLGSGDAEGARALLSTVAGSMITVAGVTFSMTLLAVSHAGAQLGPRTLSNLLRDRGNQFTLGVFTSTFLYCLLVLRAVGTTGFVPRMGVLLALVLALMSVGVLIYFIHHVPRTIHATDVVARIGRRLRESVETTRDGSRDQDGRRPGEAVESASSFTTPPSLTVRAHTVGYVSYVSHDSLVAVAEAEGCRTRVVAPAGQFVHEGSALLEIWTPASSPDTPDPGPFREAFAIGVRRSLGQDVLFPADQLLEVAIRALSPGVNDPYTAIECIDQLVAGAVNLAESPEPEGLHFDSEGELRVVHRPIGFGDFAQHVFGRLRPYAKGDGMVSMHMLRAMADLSAHVRRRDDQLVLAAEAEASFVAAVPQLDDVQAREGEHVLQAIRR